MIVPIFKSGDPQLTQNYRPISLLSPFAKIVEKCIASCMNSFLNKFNILNPNQFDFRINSSTEHAVASIFNYYIKHLENNEIVCSVFLNIKKGQ